MWGRALAEIMVSQPVRLSVIDARADALDRLPSNLETHHSAMPESIIRDAPSGAAYIVMTHDHALDFLIVKEALDRGDAAYVGLIGSATKRERFSRWYVGEGGDEALLEHLVCPNWWCSLKGRQAARSDCDPLRC